MGTAVQFNGDSAFRAIEIQNVWPHTVLHAKFLSIQLGILQAPPENSFRCSA
jgi:hypothetical protein